MCLASVRAKKRWYLDGRCSRHMTGDKSQFISLEAKNRGVVTFGDNGKGKIIDLDNILITPSTCIENILLIEGLMHNLFSISQLCNIGFNILFKSSYCIVTSSFDDSIKFIGKRHGNVYIVDLDKLKNENIKSLIAMSAKVNESS